MYIDVYKTFFFSFSQRITLMIDILHLRCDGDYGFAQNTKVS